VLLQSRGQLEPDEVSNVNHILHSGLVKDGPIAPGSTVLYSDIQRLKPDVWFNDVLMNLNCDMLNERECQKCLQNANYRKSYFVNSYFASQYKARGYDGIKSWLKNCDIFSLRRMYFIINLGNTHWAVCIVDINSDPCRDGALPKKKQIRFRDGFNQSNPAVTKMMWEWLQQAWKERKGRVMTQDESEEWQLVPCHPLRYPQKNNSDCGGIVCLICDYESDGLECDFTNEYVTNFRVNIAAAAIRGYHNYPILFL